MKKKRSRKRRNAAKAANYQNKAAMLVITFVVCILLVVLIVEGQKVNQKIAANAEEIANVQSQIDAENQRTEDIKALQEYMKSDEYIEKEAKEKLGLIKDNEIIFKEKDSK